MNKSFIKFLTDFGPLLIFFGVYYKNNKDLVSAIPALIIATIISIAVIYLIEKKIPYIPLVGAFLVSFFGGLSIFFDNPIFTEIHELIEFYPAEDYHHDYYKKNPYAGYCTYIIRPKLEKLKLE